MIYLYVIHLPIIFLNFDQALAFFRWKAGKCQEVNSVLLMLKLFSSFTGVVKLKCVVRINLNVYNFNKEKLNTNVMRQSINILYQTFISMSFQKYNDQIQ